MRVELSLPRFGSGTRTSAERLQPRDYDLLFNLGMVLADSDRPADAPHTDDRYANHIDRI